MNETHIEIRSVCALRLDAAGRVAKLRVVGVVDRAGERIDVQVCVSDADARDVSWTRDRYVAAVARIVDPRRTYAGYIVPVFTADIFVPEEKRRQAWVWIAEIDVSMSTAIPAIFIGRQQVPVHVRADYGLDSSSPAVSTVLEIHAEEEFDVGVLFVHGIGLQRRAETLAQWSAPLLRWINAWLRGATDDIARKSAGAPLEGWLHSLVLRTRWGGHGPDHAERAKNARDFVDKALAPTYPTWQDRGVAELKRLLSTSDLRSPTPAEQEEGGTVVRFIEQNLGASAIGGAAEFRDANVLDTGRRDAEPSSVEMHVRALAADGCMLRSRWMLAESHWADAFRAPSFFEFGRWCLLTAPVVVVHYVALSRLRHPKSFFRWYLSALGIAGAVMLAQAAFGLLMVLWLVPWDRLRASVLRVQLALAGVVGDSYILLEDPVQRRAILDRMQHDLNWIAQRCRRVVVIAHSQGAAVANAVLDSGEDAGIDKVHSFITLGAAVQTLEAIAKLGGRPGVRAAGWGATGCAVALAAALAAVAYGAWQFALAIGIAGLIGMVPCILRARAIHPGRKFVNPVLTTLPGKQWLDFFAARDVVPYGPLVDPGKGGDRYRPKEVRNRDSYLGDHVGYWRNPEQVVGPMARQIAAAAEFPPLASLLPDDAQVLARLERARCSRLVFLRIARMVMAGCTLTLLAVQWPYWASIGQWALAWAGTQAGTAAAPVASPGFAVWLHALVVLLPPAIHATLVNATFDAWTTSELESLLRRSAGAPAIRWAATFALLLAATLTATIYFVRPLTVWGMAGATVVSAIAAWLACRMHSRRITNGDPAGSE